MEYEKETCEGPPTPTFTTKGLPSSSDSDDNSENRLSFPED